MANLQKIKDLAKEQNVRLEDLANEAGITIQGLHKLMRENSTKIDTLEKIARILKVSPSVFLDDDTNVGSTIADHSSIAVSGNKNSVNAQTDRFIALLEKKDEQIDRLITIIEGYSKE